MLEIESIFLIGAELAVVGTEMLACAKKSMLMGINLLIC
jgi:hypothetical protein